MGLDPTLAEDLIMEAAYRVIYRGAVGELEIQNLPGYLFTCIKWQALEKLRLEQRQEGLSEEQFGALSDQQASVMRMETEILKEEIMRHLNSEDRFILNCRLKGFSFSEISDLFKEEFGRQIAENALRTKFSRSVQGLAKKLRK
jgi:DNA-directed RNA polymerase specialized sigma24 family protein